MTNLNLKKHLTTKAILKTPHIAEAFAKIDRAKFVSQALIDRAYEDREVPLLAGQTISQPSVVAFMLEKLQPKQGEKILDVGAGSGYTTALLAQITGPKGYVYGVEILPQLLNIGRGNLNKYAFRNAQIEHAQKELGLKKYAPYHKILVSAYATEVPQELVDQLAIGGRMVIPIKHSIIVVNKISEKETKTEEFKGFVFVPLINTRKSNEKTTTELL